MKMSNDGRISGRRLQARNRVIYQRDGGQCRNCATPVHLGSLSSPTRAQVDHIQPIRFGGTEHWDNLQLLCLVCNQAKGAATPQPPHKPTPSRQW